jgi:hypothetical protein
LGGSDTSRLEVQKLPKRFGDVAAVENLSFVAREGAATGVCQPFPPEQYRV